MPDAVATAAPARRRGALALGAVLLLISLNLRMAVSSVGPVLHELRAGTGLSSTAVGLLTTLPVLCFGLGAPLAPALSRRAGGEAVLLGCLVAAAVGTALRAVPGTAALYGGSMLVGIGIALANVVLPSVIKRDFPRPGAMMGVYSTGLGASGALAAGLTVPIEHASGSWRWALGAWALPGVLAAVLWVPAVIAARRGAAGGAEMHPPAVRLRRDTLAWQVTLLFACQSFLFYAFASWVPSVLRDAGMSASTAGLMLSIALIVGLPASLVMPVAAARRRDQRLVGVVPFALWCGGLTGLVLAPAALAPLWMVLVGLGQASGIGLVLMLFVLRAPDDAHTAALSGMAQSIGYLVAGTGPFVVGAVHDLTGGWTAPMALLVAVSVGFLAAALGAGRPLLVRGS